MAWIDISHVALPNGRARLLEAARMKQAVRVAREGNLDYAAFLHLQTQAIVEQFFSDGAIAWIAVPALDDLMRRQTLDGGYVVALPGAKSNDAVIWRDTRNRSELWVRPDDRAVKETDLHERAWRSFVRLVADTDPVGTVAGRRLFIDHLYPGTAAARLGLAYVRVMAVDRRSNSLLGSTTEQAAAGPKPGTRRPRSITFFTLAKVSGFQMSFAQANDSTTVARALIDHLRAQGYSVPGGAEMKPWDVDFTASTLDWFRGDRA